MVLGAEDAPIPEPRGVFAITRHPMMWSFTLWGTAHILVFPTTENIILAKQSGVNNYIVKPFNAETLKAKIAAVLGPL